MNAKIQTLNQSPTDSKCTAILVYIWGEIFLAYNARIYGGGFRLAIMRVYICGKIFALHNTHIKRGENPKIIMRKLSRIYNFFRQKKYMYGRFLKLHIIHLYSTPTIFTLTIYSTKESFTFQNRHSKNLEQK